MANIHLSVPEQLRHVEYIDILVLKIQDYKGEFSPYLDTLNVNVVFQISSKIDEQVVNTMTKIEEGVFNLTVPLKRHWINSTELTPLPRPKELYNSVIFALDSALKDFSVNAI